MTNQLLRQFVQNRFPFDSILKDSFFDPDLAKNASVQIRESVPVNIKRTKDSAQIEIYVPGYDKSEISISIDNKDVSVSGTKEAKDDYRYQEFNTASFERIIRLDDSIDTDSGKATIENGILKLTFSVKETAKVKEIVIS